MNTTTMNELNKNQIVTLSIPAAAPRKTLDGNLHEGGQQYRVLGFYCGCMVRLSRTTDRAKLIIAPEFLA